MTTARYCVTFGLSGCYLPDSQGYIEACTRSDLASHIKAELQFHDMPASLFREVRISKLWTWIKKHGSSVAHFDLHHKGYVLSFIGMTEEEYAQQADAE